MTATCVKGAGNVFLKSPSHGKVAPLPCDGAVDALLKRHGFGVAQIVDGALRSGLLIQSVVIFSADILHQAVIFAASRKDEVRKKLHVDVSAARDVIDGARLESFADIGQGAAGVVDISQGPMVVNVNRVGKALEGTGNEFADYASIIAVGLAGPVGIE